ncbi:hypothetical protein [Streptomyces sp. NPDC001508]|uniref:hypothetical protein n=1 Tax=Streptomyces sp. NPDC001508 TaxID=3154656 RepID=UPI00333164FB
MLRADRLLSIRRDPHSGEVLARGGDPQAHSILQRTGFVAVVRLHDTYHRAPIGLGQDTENRLASSAVARLRAVGYDVACDEPFDTGRREPPSQSLGSQAAQLADRIREATTTEDAAEVLTELTADHDGILAGIEAVLTATADFHEGLDDPTSPYVARRLRDLADERLSVIRSDLTHTRNELADRHAPHPGRTTPTGAVPAAERKASAQRACPQSPSLPAPSAAPGRRR